MAFNTPIFLFGFLPLFFLAYYSTPRRHANKALLAGSLIFYGWAEPLFLFVVLASSALDYILARRVAATEIPRHRKLWLAAALSQNLGILAYFKYSAFLYLTIADLFGTSVRTPDFLSPLLPLAISFVTFEKITYVVDVARGTGRPAKNLSTYLTYVLLFPKLIAGPIVKYRDIADQLIARARPGMDDIATGATRFCFGLAKKSLLADTLSVPVQTIFGLPAAQLSFGTAWLGLACFTLQIYLDFSGYSDMAIGLARMMGFRLKENFNLPYLAGSFTDFWRRWHISLSSWIREYLYIPLGGNRVTPPRLYFNLLICFLACGLWHGAKYHFVVWGLYHGLFLIADRLFWLRLQPRVPRLLAIVVTLFFVMIGWVFFRAPTLNAAFDFLGALANPAGPAGQFIPLTPLLIETFVAGILVSVMPPFSDLAFARRWRGPSSGSARFLFGAVLLVCSLVHIVASSFVPFLYFQF